MLWLPWCGSFPLDLKVLVILGGRIGRSGLILTLPTDTAIFTTWTQGGRKTLKISCNLCGSKAERASNPTGRKLDARWTQMDADGHQ